METPGETALISEFRKRFNGRSVRQSENMKRLREIAHWGGPDTLAELENLRPLGVVTRKGPDDKLYALRSSILALWLEAAECFIFGHFQACILTCGAVVERCLKLEYQQVHGALPPGYWTLGKCVHQLPWDGILDDQAVALAQQIIDPRNSRAHALLEHDNPALAYFGGDRGIEVRSPHHYLIEPYRGDAEQVISVTWQLLKTLYGKKPEASGC